MRVLFFAGKGGVGKTSVAAATGVRAAQSGLRTIILSLDVAHSLSDIFDLPIHLLDHHRGRPTKIQENLWIQELDIQEEIGRNWGDIHKYLSSLLNTSGLDEILAEELAILPGMEEVSLLLYINRYVREEKFDAIILDCAPTGESLRFISIPTTLEWYIKKVFKMERTLARYVRPVAKRLYDVPLPGEDYFRAIEHLFSRLQGVDEILGDHNITTVRLVTNPEKIVLKETQRAFMYFSLYKMHIDAVVMNRVLPEGIKEPYFDEWKASQKKYMEKAHTYFDPVPILPVHLHEDEIVGPQRLSHLAEQIYGERDPLSHFYRGEPYTFRKEKGEYELSIKIPFAAREDFELTKIADELVIRLGAVKRQILLPRQVAASEAVRARIDGQHLRISFRGENGHGTQEGCGT
jgi:arsenite/tail-anchored protein-transporting ATPase